MKLHFRRISGSLLVVVLAVVLLSSVSIVHIPSTRAAAPNSKIILNYGSSGYHYLSVAHGDDQGFQNPGYNDSSFNRDGVAAFGFIADSCPLNPTIKTSWPSNTDLLIRKTIDLPQGGSGLTVHVAIDNDAIVYWNGNQIGSITHEGCAQYNTLVASVPNSIVITGKNLLAIRGIDRGSSTYLDMEVREK